MTQVDNSFNLLNQDASNKLNFYNKVIPNLPHSLNDLLEKAKSVESKLDTNKNGANKAGIENSEVNKYANMKEKQKRDTKFFEFDNFRRVNNYIPKIHINKHKERDGENFILPFASNKDDNFKGIMSLYNEKDLKDYCEPLPNNFFVMQEKNEEGNIIRNDIDYDYTLPPNFYTNRYVEYIYEDRGDKLYEDNNELKNLFGKNPNKDNKNEFNSITKGSPYLKAYHNILEKEKEDIENENKEIYQNEMSRGLEFTLDSEESQNILNFLRNNKDSYKEKNPLENFLEKNLPINQRVPFINVPNEAKKEEKDKKERQKEEMKASALLHQKIKEENKIKEKENEKVFRIKYLEKIKEEEEIDRLNAQKRKQKELELKMEVEKQWQQKLAQYQLQKEAELKNREKLQIQQQAKKYIIEQEKQRLIKENEALLKGYYPLGYQRAMNSLKKDINNNQNIPTIDTKHEIIMNNIFGNNNPNKTSDYPKFGNIKNYVYDKGIQEVNYKINVTNYPMYNATANNNYDSYPTPEEYLKLMKQTGQKNYSYAGNTDTTCIPMRSQMPVYVNKALSRSISNGFIQNNNFSNIGNRRNLTKSNSTILTGKEMPQLSKYRIQKVDDVGIGKKQRKRK